MTLLTRAAGAFLVSGLLASSAMAATPLPAGKAAGAKEAALTGPALIWVGAAAIIAITVAVVASNNDGGTTGTTTTATGTAP